MKLIRYTPFPLSVEVKPYKKDKKQTLMMRIFRSVFGFYYLVIAYCAVAIFMVYVFGHRSFLEAIMPYAMSGFQKLTELILCLSITTAIHESSR
jgi:hypothetical protein